MPPGPTAPCSLAGLLAEFRPCFTAPTFQTFIGLVVGLIAQTRRRTVCGMLTGAGLERVWHHSRAHRLFTNARWSGDALGLALADLIVARLLPAGAALTIAVDDTLFKRSGKKVFGAARLMTASRRGGEGPETHRVRQLLGRGRHHRAAVVSVPPGVPAGAGPAVATPTHREDRLRARTGRADRRPLSRPDGARGRGRRLRRGTPARRGRPDQLDQPVEGHLGAARAAPAPHRTLRATPHPRRPVRHPADIAALARTTNTWRSTRVRRYGRTDTVQITERFCLWYGSFRSRTVRVILVRDDKPRTRGGDDRGYGLVGAENPVTSSGACPCSAYQRVPR